MSLETLLPVILVAVAAAGITALGLIRRRSRTAGAPAEPSTSSVHRPNQPNRIVVAAPPRPMLPPPAAARPAAARPDADRDAGPRVTLLRDTLAVLFAVVLVALAGSTLNSFGDGEDGGVLGATAVAPGANTPSGGSNGPGATPGVATDGPDRAAEPPGVVEPGPERATPRPGRTPSATRRPAATPRSTPRPQPTAAPPTAAPTPAPTPEPTPPPEPTPAPTPDPTPVPTPDPTPTPPPEPEPTATDGVG